MDPMLSSEPHERVVRRGRTSWLTNPPQGKAYVGVESRAFGAMPVSVPEDDPVPHEASPGELLAVTHSIFMTWVLSRVLREAGSTASELVVEADCTFSGSLEERVLIAIDLNVFGRVPDLDAEGFRLAVDTARDRYVRSIGAREMPGQLNASLAGPQSADRTRRRGSVDAESA